MSHSRFSAPAQWVPPLLPVSGVMFPLEHTFTLWWGWGGSQDTCTGQAQQVGGALAHLQVCPAGSPGYQRLPSKDEQMGPPDWLLGMDDHPPITAALSATGICGGSCKQRWEAPASRSMRGWISIFRVGQDFWGPLVNHRHGGDRGRHENGNQHCTETEKSGSRHCKLGRSLLIRAWTDVTNVSISKAGTMQLLSPHDFVAIIV